MTNYYCDCCRKQRREAGDLTSDHTRTCYSCNKHITWLSGVLKRSKYEYTGALVWNLTSLNRQIYLWHLKAFPNATKDTQRMKTRCEELEVARESLHSYEYFQECCDVYISACAEWMRFKSEEGKRKMLDLIMFIAPVYQENFFSLVADKLLVCKNRKWNETEPGVYQHVDD